MIAAIRVDDPGKLADTIGANLQLTIEEKQELLEIFDPVDRLTRVADMLDIEIEKLNVDRTIQGRVKRQMERAQKEYYLNEKIKAIQKELGRGEKSEFDELKKKIEAAGMTKDAHEKAMAGTEAAGERCRRCRPNPPSRATIWTGCWRCRGRRSPRKSATSSFAEKVLEADHYGLEKIKERILEFLAVRRLVKNPQGLDPVLRRASGRGQDLAGHVDRARPPAASSSACRWAACGTKPRSAATAAPTSARCPARSSR